MIEKSLLWNVIVQVGEIPEGGLHRDIEADAATRREIAALAGLRDLPRLAGSFDLFRAGDGRVHVSGRVFATAGQTCVVTLEPMESSLDESVDLIFAPEADIVVASDENGHDTDNPAHDPPEPIVNGALNLGAVTIEFLMLGLDPYPRKPDAVFNAVVTPADPQDHPFAALAALKTPGSSVKPRKPKDK